MDDNQSEIVDYLRKAGASVRSTAMIGQGFPDLAVGYQGYNFLIEIKDGKKPPSARKLTPDEQEFHDEWRGNVFIVESIEDVARKLIEHTTRIGNGE